MQLPAPVPASFPTRRDLMASGAGLALGLLCRGTLAQPSPYPSRPTRFVVGGGPDALARIVADRLGSVWSQAVFVEQKNGAGGALAADFVAKSPPDGYNWLLSSGAYTISSIVQAHQPYSFVNDLAPVTLIATLPFVLVVNDETPMRSVAELVAQAKRRPGTLNYASSGTGAPPHLAGEMLKQMAGIDVVHVPYKSVVPGLADVIAGRAQWMFSPAPAALGLVQSGKLKAIAVSSPKRYFALPDVPTMVEAGYADFRLVGWNGIHVPAKTPQPIIEKIATDVARVMASGDARERAQAAGFEPAPMSAAEFAEFVRADLERIAHVVKAGNIKAD